MQPPSEDTVTAAPASALTETEIRTVGIWLTANGFGPGSIRDVRPIGGGTQNIMVRFTFADVSYVLRRGPRHLRPRSNESILREGQVLTALADTHVPHPRSIATCADPDVLGGAVFYIMEPVDGFNPSEELPALHAHDAAVRHAMGLRLVDALAALGAVDHRSVGLTDFGRPDGFLERQVPRWLSELDGYRRFGGYPGDLLPSVDAIASWLEASRPRTWRPGIMHGDFHAANAMFDRASPEVVAVVDWEMCTIGDPLLDLGWLIATWQLPDAPGMLGSGLMRTSGLATAAELAEQYASRSGRDLGMLSWYVVLACFKLGIVLEGTHARSYAGEAARDTGRDLHLIAVRLFERALGVMSGQL